MAVAISLAAVVMLLFGAGLGVLAMVVIGIHRVDRTDHRLTDDARSHVDAATRRVLGVGVRTPGPRRDEQD
jgi:hypothetical protein